MSDQTTNAKMMSHGFSAMISGILTLGDSVFVTKDSIRIISKRIASLDKQIKKIKENKRKKGTNIGDLKQKRSEEKIALKFYKKVLKRQQKDLWFMKKAISPFQKATRIAKRNNL